jgi:hypothetical protein
MRTDRDNNDKFGQTVRSKSPRTNGGRREKNEVTALPESKPTVQPLPLAVTLTTDEANAAASALEVLDLYYQTLSPRAKSALKSLKQQLGGGR